VRLRSGHAFDGNVVRGQLKAVMADFKIPARFIVVTAFPVAQGPNGEKIQRLKLKVMAADAIAATA
jgi:fatty-acyl-CoA synthase